LDVCPPIEGVRMSMSYTFNTDGVEHIADAVGDVRFYAFDSATGMLRGTGRATRADIARGFVDLELPEGNYTIVAWGSSGDDLIDGGYDVRGTVFNSYRLETTDTSDFDDLFFAIAKNVRVTLNEDPEVSFSFKQFTSRLQVEVHGLNAFTRAGEAPLDVYVEGPKGLYNFDGTVNADSPVQRFESTDEEWKENRMDVTIPMQRFDVAFHGDSNNAILLKVAKPVAEGQAEQLLIRQIDVLDAIMSAPDGAFDSQDDIDKAEVFNIMCRVAVNLSVTVFVNGWEVMQIGPPDMVLIP
jgi:hypothetical protein